MFSGVSAGCCLFLALLNAAGLQDPDFVEPEHRQGHQNLTGQVGGGDDGCDYGAFF